MQKENLHDKAAIAKPLVMQYNVKKKEEISVVQGAQNVGY